MRHVFAVTNDLPLADELTRLLQAKRLICNFVYSESDAQDFLQKNETGVVVIDLDLPGISGFELLRVLRERSCNIPVILVSSCADSNQWLHALELGADDLLCKPVSGPVLIAHILALLRRRNFMPEKLCFGNLCLDDATRTFSVDGSVIILSPREWTLLKHLLINAEKQVSKQHLLDATCSSVNSSSVNLIEVHIARLRKKIASGDVHIRTIRGYGYVLARAQKAVQSQASEPTRST